MPSAQPAVRVIDLSKLSRSENLFHWCGNFRAQKEVILGFSPEGGRPFLLGGRAHYRPDFAPGEDRVGTAHPYAIRASVFVRLVLVPEAVALVEKQLLSRGEPAETHASPVSHCLAVLKDSIGVVPAAVSGPAYLQAPAVVQIFKHGFVDSDGDRIPMEIYKVVPESFQDWVKKYWRDCAREAQRGLTAVARSRVAGLGWRKALHLPTKDTVA